MKKILKFAAPVLSLVALVLAAAPVPLAAAADSATMYLSPSSGTYDVGDSFNVAVHEDSGSTAVNAVQANLSYSTSKLQYVSYTSSSAYNVEAESSSSGGTLKFARASITPRTGDQVVVTVKFKALAATSGTGVSIASGSSVNANDGSGTNILSGTSGGTYKVVSTASPSPSPPPPPPASTTPPPPSGGGSTSSGGSSGSGGSTGSSGSSSGSKDTSAPKVSGVTVSNPTSDSVVISWQTSEPATSEVRYGLDTDRSLVAIDSKLVKDHQLTVGSGVLTAGTNYHYVVRSVDAAGNVATSKDAIFATIAANTGANNGSFLQDSSVLAVIGGIAVATFLIVMVLVVLRHMHHHKLEQQELSRHFPDNFSNKPPQGPAPPPTVFTPGS
jgi:hypothetical protein